MPSSINRFYQFVFLCVRSVPDTPTATTKTSRNDSKESAPVVAVPTANDSKPPQPQVQPTAESKPLQRNNSHESPEKEVDNDRRAAPVVSISLLISVRFVKMFEIHR